MQSALVKVPVAGLMGKPESLSTLEDEVVYGMKVEILNEDIKGWVKIRTHYRYEGLVNTEDLLFGKEYVDAWEVKKLAVVTHPYADVLTESKVQGARIIALPTCAQVALLSEPDEKGWVKVGLVDGQTGFMKEKFLGEWNPSMYVDEFSGYKKRLPDKNRILQFINEQYGLTEDEFRDKVVKTALKFMGVQYRWGGKTSLGIDCSGLCSTSYMLSGLVIYRDAKIQEGFPVHEIKFDEKKPGDLLFFPGHVAMYIGDDRYVHSTARRGSDGVVINSLNKDHDDYREDLLNMITAVGSVF